MNAIILAGGYGTRLAEHTRLIPKPMVNIGDKPIIWHIMERYAMFEIKNFVIALGYRGDVIKSYFLEHYSLNSDIKINLSTGKIKQNRPTSPDWDVNLIDTGLGTLTGGRLAKLKNRIPYGETFLVTYGDGLSDINIKDLINFHKKHGKIATVSAVRPPARFGELDIDGNTVKSFEEKPQMNRGWINGGFFVFEYDIFDFIGSSDVMLEREPLINIAKEGQLMAFKHQGFWQCMDNVRDLNFLNELWTTGQAPWTL